MKKCTDAAVDWMIQNRAIDESERELYAYAVHSFLMSLSPLVLAVGIGFCVGNVKLAVILVLPFMFLRKFSGGYHAKSLKSCLFGSCLLLFLCTLLSMHVQCDWGLAAITIAAAISLVVCSPIDNENRILDQGEKKLYKKVTIMLVTVFLSLDMVLFFLNQYSYVACISVGIQLSAGLQIPCIMKRKCK